MTNIPISVFRLRFLAIELLNATCETMKWLGMAELALDQVKVNGGVPWTASQLTRPRPPSATPDQKLDAIRSFHNKLNEEEKVKDFTAFHVWGGSLCDITIPRDVIYMHMTSLNSKEVANFLHKNCVFSSLIKMHYIQIIWEFRMTIEYSTATSFSERNLLYL